jgi:hypothetical protein
MAAFQSLAIHLLKNSGKQLDRAPSHRHYTTQLTNCPELGTHTQTHTQIQSHTLSLTHLHTLPQTPPTHSLTNFNAISVNDGRFSGP